MDKTFIRKLILSYLPVNGYYRFDDIFQILPPDVTAPKMQFSNSHHPLIIEYCVDIPNNRIIQIEENSNTRESDFDWALIGLASIEKLTELIRLLN
ncbi:MAG: hypothetical protein FP831_13540, partial [Anaerolineae bacterium]|nr:hypothetical protein [Anaerolineae bacterium]